MTVQKSAYDQLKERFSELYGLEYASSILGKDAESAMPSGSGADRVHQMVSIQKAKHFLISDPRVEEWLNESEMKKDQLSIDDQCNLALMRQNWIHQAGLPSDLAGEVARLESEGEQIHTANYRSGQWNAVKDWYAHSFSIMREVGQIKQSRLGVSSPYEALLDTFSPGMRVALVEKEFHKLDQALRVMIPEAMDRQSRCTPPIPLHGTFSTVAQMELNNHIASLIGFDFNRGALYSIKGHPSSGGSPDDSRITAHCDETDFLQSLYSTIHEGGHGMYQQGLPPAFRYQPAGEALGMALHESQSMVMERQACQTAEFFSFLSPLAQKIFDQPNANILSAENLSGLKGKVTPSLVRIDADEMTYPMHVVLRFELEKSIIEGKLDVKDLPEAWNDGMKQRLGIVPQTHDKGCMQDVHWTIGYIGYFPAYTLGAMGAAQFFAAAKRARPEIEPEIAKGNFKPLAAWLHDNVHGKGSLLTADQLFMAATGKVLGSDDLLESFAKRYLGKPLPAASQTTPNAPTQNKI